MNLSGAARGAMADAAAGPTAAAAVMALTASPVQIQASLARHLQPFSLSRRSSPVVPIGDAAILSAAVAVGIRLRRGEGAASS